LPAKVLRLCDWDWRDWDLKLDETLATWEGFVPYLEDHPRTCKWLITMIHIYPLTGIIPFPNGLDGF